jgi:hypothetical protein
MIKSYWYFILNNSETKEFIDNENTIPLETATIIFGKKTFEIALLGNAQTIQMIRILVPDLELESFQESDLKIVQSIKEHMLSILRLNYDQNVGAIFNVYNFRQKNEAPNLSFIFNTPLNSEFDVRNRMIIGSFENSLNIRTQVQLLADTVRKDIPIQYRFLGLYKLLELEFKKGGKWTDEFSDYIKEFQEEFEKLSLSARALENYIHELRDKCAHIKSNKDVLGVTELSQTDTLTVEKIIPLMTKIGAFIINRRYSNESFGIQIN